MSFYLKTDRFQRGFINSSQLGTWSKTGSLASLTQPQSLALILCQREYYSHYENMTDKCQQEDSGFICLFSIRVILNDNTGQLSHKYKIGKHTQKVQCQLKTCLDQSFLIVYSLKLHLKMSLNFKVQSSVHWKIIKMC